MLTNLFRSFRNSQARRRSAHLTLEGLEDRQLLATFVVSTVADEGPGSLRQAILDANQDQGPNEIRFDLQGCPCTILVGETSGQRLPAISTRGTIDGTTAPDYQGAPVVELDGTLARGFGVYGLTLNQGSQTVKGLVINRFRTAGVFMGGGDVLQGTYIGTDLLGQEARPNGIGIRVGGGGNQIGGLDPAARNLISGNQLTGIEVSGPYTNARIQGNYIGTDVSGTLPLGNGGDGVLVDGALPILIQQNAIYASGNLGIRLINNGNHMQEAPDSVGGFTDGTTTTVSASLLSAPNTEYTIEFFASDACNPSGFGEGQRYLGSAMLTTDDDGVGAAGAVFDGDTTGQFLATTATDPANNTSQFSLCEPIGAPGMPGRRGGTRLGMADVAAVLARGADSVGHLQAEPRTPDQDVRSQVLAEAFAQTWNGDALRLEQPSVHEGVQLDLVSQPDFAALDGFFINHGGCFDLLRT